MKANSPYFSQQSTISRFCPKGFIPDADLTKREWELTKKVVFDTSYHPQIKFSEARTEVASLWSETFLYFAFTAHFTELFTYAFEDASQERVGLWDRDVVEVFLNPFPERINVYWEFEVAPNNQWVDLAIDLDQNPFFDASWNSGFEHATRIDHEKKIWYCEMRIPVNSFGIDRIKADAQWRINFYRCDGLGDDTRRRFLAWSPTYEPSFHVPQHFGLIRFVR